MICSKCGKEFEGRFCPWCGAASEESEKASAADMIAEEEAPKEETPKAEAPKAETPKAETPKEEAPKAETEQAATEEKAEGSAGAGKIKCPKCGNVFSGKFCTECGYKAAELDKCPVCGAPHKAGDKFCAECGYSYEKKPNAAAATVAGIGTAIKNSCKNALAFCKKHSKKVIAAAVAVALILVIVVPISVVFTSPVQPANVDRIKIGDTQERVLSILGDPYDWKEGDTTFEYYSDNYLKIKKELDKISNMEDMESFGDFADALEKEEELNSKLETLEYKETTISFDEDGLVTKVVYNACVRESEEQAKEIKSKEVLTESIRVYEKSEVVYTIKYTDKSIVKAIAQVTPDMLLDEYAFSIYDPFAPENKIELSCKVVEDPNSNILYATTLSGVNYNLTKDGTLTISGNGKVKKGGIRNTKDIKNIIVQEGITEIEQGVFGECTKIESITVPFVGASPNETENTHFGYIFGDKGDDSVPKSLKEVVITDGENIPYSAFSGCDSLTSITIPEGVTSIGDYAFTSCDSLTNITIPDSVTSIGEEAFRECRALKSITIPDSVTSIGSSAFYGVTTEIKWGSNSQISEMGTMVFYGYEGTKIIIPNSVTSIGERAFYWCSSLTNITIPDSVTSIGNEAFRECRVLKSITISEGVTSIGNSAFNGCTSLTSITIPDSVTSIGDEAFRECRALKSITISEGVTSIGNSAFNGCSSLTSITIPNSVTSIGGSAFSNCSSLTSITIPEGVTSIGNEAFRNCSSLTIYCEASSKPSGWNSSWNYSDCPVVWNCNNNEVATDGNIYYIHNGIRYALKEGEATVAEQPRSLSGEIVLPKSISYNGNTYSVTSIGGGAFWDCSGLTSITIPNSVTSIGDSAFRSCSSLTSIVIPNSVTSIGDRAFWYCDSLTSINIPDGVTSIGEYAFYNCDSLTSITIPDSVTSIGGCAFEGCSSLTSITIPNSVTSIGNYAFSSCSSLTSITIPEGVTSIGIEAFSGTNLIQKENGVSYVDKWVVNCDSSVVGQVQLRDNTVGIAAFAFAYCDSLTSITIPDSVTSIGFQAFLECRALKSITILEGVTSIGRYAFENCDSLTSIVIPDSVTSIGDYVFSACFSLRSINFQGTMAQWKAIDNSSWNYNTGTLTIICTDGKLDKYGNQIQ